MATLEHTSSAHERDEQQAIAYINGTIAKEAEKGSANGAELARTIEENTKHLSEGVRNHVRTYTKGVVDIAHDTEVRPLERGVGGQYDGRTKTIATNTMMVRKNIMTTVKNVTQTGKHETYHEENDHLAPLAPAPSAVGDTVVTIGNKKFTEEALVEGLTVKETGHDFVSDEYVGFKDGLEAAVASSDITLDDVKKAVNEDKDLTAIDDEAREMEKAGTEASEAQFALVA